MTIAKLVFWLASFGVVALLAVQVSCEELVYHSDEIKAEKTFRTIANGIVEADLIKQLGEPTGRITFDPARGTFQYTTIAEPTSVQEFRTFDEARKYTYSELRFLRASVRTNTILVFIEGTVHGYFYF